VSFSKADLEKFRTCPTHLPSVNYTLGVLAMYNDLVLNSQAFSDTWKVGRDMRVQGEILGALHTERKLVGRGACHGGR
jgi:hypothetical protein